MRSMCINLCIFNICTFRNGTRCCFKNVMGSEGTLMDTAERPNTYISYSSTHYQAEQIKKSRCVHFLVKKKVKK